MDRAIIQRCGRALCAISILAGATLAAPAAEVELTGHIEIETRYFPQSAGLDDQDDALFGLSFAIQPELFYEWEDSGWRIAATPFFRWDESDPQRTHFDLRELYVQNRFEDLEVSLGVRKVFWGVAESIHLVDFINQVDLIENIDEEDRLGQPMAQLAYITEIGTFELFGMPYFRERTFPGRSGRLRTDPLIDTDHVEFESAAEQWHLDVAARYSISRGPIDLGLYHFYGTNREPTLVPGRISSRGELLSLVPRYEIVHQTGLDLQYTKESWLWKLEALARSGRGDDTIWAGVGGLEYTFYDVAESGIDLGLLAEYLYDSRGDSGSSVFQDDIFAGVRLAFNDTQDSQILFGAIVDRDYGSTFFNVEASRRINDHWKAAAEIRAFFNIDERDPLANLERDSYLQLTLSRYF